MDFKLGEGFLANFADILGGKAFKKGLKITRALPPYTLEKMAESAYVLSFPVPGIEAQDVRLQAVGENLAIEVTPKVSQGHFIHKNFEPKAWRQTFTLSEGLHPHLAYLKNGILRVELFKLKGEKLHHWQATPYAPASNLRVVPITSVANDS